MLAVVQNADAARLMGINVRAAIAARYAVSTALAGLAGLLIAPLFSVHSDMGTLFGIKAFAVAILGGIGSAPGRDAGRPDLRGERGAHHGAVRLGLHADRHVHGRDRRACPDAARPARPRRREEGLSRMACCPRRRHASGHRWP